MLHWRGFWPWLQNPFAWSPSQPLALCSVWVIEFFSSVITVRLIGKPRIFFPKLNISIKHRQIDGQSLRFDLHNRFWITVGCLLLCRKIRWFQHSRDSLKGSGSSDVWQVSVGPTRASQLDPSLDYIVGMLTLSCQHYWSHIQMRADRSRWSLETVTSHSPASILGTIAIVEPAITSLPLGDILSLIGYLGQKWTMQSSLDWYVAGESRTTTSICSEECCTGVVLAVTSQPICDEEAFYISYIILYSPP